MALELVKESIKVNQIIGRFVDQTIIENDIIVPDTKEDVSSILSATGDIVVGSTEIENKRINISGNIFYKILYVCDETHDGLRSINTKIPFMYNWDVENINPQILGKIRMKIEDVEHDILNGRKINIKTAVSMSCTAMEEHTKELVCDLIGVDGLQTMRDDIAVSCQIFNHNTEHRVKDTIIIADNKPAIKEILSSYYRVTHNDYKVLEGKVIVNADLSATILYIEDGEEGDIRFIEQAMHISCPIEINEIDPLARCMIEYQVKIFNIEQVEDDDGEMRKIECDALIDIYVDGYYNRNINIIKDAYSTKSKLKLEKVHAKMARITNEFKAQFAVKDTAIVNSGSPEIKEIINVASNPVIYNCRIDEGKLIAEGTISSDILYITNQQEYPISSYKYETPFKYVVDVEKDAKELEYEALALIAQCNYSITSWSEIDFKYIVDITVRTINNNETFDLAYDINEISGELNRKDCNRANIILCFCQPEDTLWSIAKRYETTVDDIKELNGITEWDKLKAGQQLIVSRYST